MKTRFNTNKIMLMICLAAAIAPAKAQRLSLDSVIVKVSSNPSLLAYDARINAENMYAAGAKNLDAPKLSAGQYQTPYQFSPNMGSFMISGEQMFTNPAKLRAKEDYMQGVAKVTAEDKNYVKNQLIAQAKQYYYDQLVISKKLTVLESTQNLLDYMLKDADIRLTYGKEKLTNIYKAKAERFELDNTREQLSNELKQKTIMLNTLMHRDKQTPFSTDTTIVLKSYETALTDTASLADSRSDVKSINRSIALQQLNAQVEYSKRKPDYGIQAAHMLSYGGYPNQYVLMASVTIPVAPWASKEYKANLKGIKYEVEELEQKRVDILNQAEGQLAGFRADLGSKKRQLKNYEQNIIPVLQNTYKTALQAYEQNTGDLATVLNGIKDLQAARMDALDRLQEILSLQVAYEKENEKY